MIVDMDKDGLVSITPRNEVEAYALNCWYNDLLGTSEDDMPTALQVCQIKE